MIEVTLYKKLTGRAITVMQHLFEDVKIYILDPKKHNSLVLYINGPLGFVKWSGSWEDIMKHITMYRPGHHCLKGDMSPEEIDLQLSIRGY